MPRPAPAFLALALIASASGTTSAPQAGPPARGFAPGAPVPTSHIRLGPDSNACGITPPRGGPPRRGKAGLVVWLHGGMRSADREKGFEAHRAWLPYLPPRRYWLCGPSAYGGAEWTTPAGLAHIEGLIAHMLAAYPIDSTDISLVGVSDGCLGVIAYSLAGRHVPRRRVLISSAPQLVLPAERMAGIPRFALGRWDFLQGGQDRLFPSDRVFPYLQRFAEAYPNAAVHRFPDGEHDFSWYSAHARDTLMALFAAEAASQKTPAAGADPGRPERKN